MIIPAAILIASALAITAMFIRFARATRKAREDWGMLTPADDAADPYQLTEDHIDHSHKDHI